MDEIRFKIFLILYGKEIGVYLKNEIDGISRIYCLLCHNRSRSGQFAPNTKQYLEGSFREHLISVHQDYLRNRKEKPEPSNFLLLSKSDIASISARNNKEN